MNYTQNYHLPQWAETDRVLMQDFNQMSVDIEAGIESAKSEALSAASAAHTAANAAQATADAALAALPYVIGSYGAGGEPYIELGFRPRAVYISGEVLYIDASAPATDPITPLGAYSAFIAEGSSLKDLVTFTDTGFVVKSKPYSTFPRLNHGKKYYYIAFR